MIKKKIKIILNFIKRLLTFFIKNTIPEPRPIKYPRPTAFEIFEKEQQIACYNEFKKHFLSSVILDEINIREYSIKKALENDHKNEKAYLEFGVYKGDSINLFSKLLKTEIFGFDSFEGLSEDWPGYTDHSIGHFNLKGKIPKFEKNVIIIKGSVNQTLPVFLEKKKPLINFVHMDMDTYETTKFILQNIKEYLDKNSIILFDELYNYTGWEVGEYKALKEVFKETEYKFIAFSKNESPVAIKIL
jgi:hypothetical protein